MNLTPDNPMNRTVAVTLVFEAIVFILAIPGMIMLEDLGLVVPFVTGLGATALAVVAAGTLRRPFGWALVWLTQVVGVALGLLTSAMFVAGGMFALLVVVEFVLGRRLEAAR